MDPTGSSLTLRIQSVGYSLTFVPGNSAQTIFGSAPVPNDRNYLTGPVSSSLVRHAVRCGCGGKNAIIQTFVLALTHLSGVFVCEIGPSELANGQEREGQLYDMGVLGGPQQHPRGTIRLTTSSGCRENHNAWLALTEDSIKFGCSDPSSRPSRSTKFAESGGGKGSGSLASMSEYAFATISRDCRRDAPSLSSSDR